MTDSDSAVVMRDFGNVVREGRGFSLPELASAGINPHHARRAGLKVDVLRKSVHQENVDKLAPHAKRIKEDLLAKKNRPAKQAPAKKGASQPEPQKEEVKAKGRKTIGLRRAKKKD
ncbi:MAG: ribosomal protein L13e [Nitrososphaera sp.]|jgi:hypothetical protein